MHLTPSPSTMAPRDALGCTASTLVHDDELDAGGVRVYRKAVTMTELGPVETAPSDRGLLLGISLAPGHRRRIVHARHASTHDFGCGAIYLRDFGERYRADMKTGFDFLLVEFPQAVLRQTTERPLALGELLAASPVGAHDAVLHHLALALLPALGRPQPGCGLFVEQVTAAMAAQLLLCAGASQPAGTRARRRLSPRQEARAKEMLSMRVDGDQSAQAVAEACGLSRSYFIEAFRETTGQTPYQWVQAQRLARAQALLARPGLSLAAIALACGFADQSHFTRVFTRHMGMPPGTWRRSAGH